MEILWKDSLWEIFKFTATDKSTFYILKPQTFIEELMWLCKNHIEHSTAWQTPTSFVGTLECHVIFFPLPVSIIKIQSLAAEVKEILPRPILFGLVSRLQPWLLGTLLRLSEGDGTGGPLADPLLSPPYALPKSLPGELDLLPARKKPQTYSSERLVTMLNAMSYD